MARENALITSRIRKIKNRILAIPAIDAAIPVKPKIAARIASIKKVSDQPSTVVSPYWVDYRVVGALHVENLEFNLQSTVSACGKRTVCTALGTPRRPSPKCAGRFARSMRAATASAKTAARGSPNPSYALVHVLGIARYAATAQAPTATQDNGHYNVRPPSTVNTWPVM